jgi:hypothetical protein
MCDCIDKLEKELTEKYGDVQFTNLRQFIVHGTGEIIIKPEPLRFIRPVKNKYGKILKKTTEGHVSSYFCQFCGQPYANETTTK